MATIEAALYTRLGGFAGLGALVANRIYPLHLPQRATLPAISFRRVDARRAHKMGVDSQVVIGRWQFDIWGDAYDDAAAARDQLRLALQRWTNASSPVVQDTYVDDEQDLFEEAEDGGLLVHLTLDAVLCFDE